MATRQTRLVIKNNTVPSAPFSGATLLKGEAIVNTADGILMFSGITSSTSEWTPAGPGGNATFFEVGSNLYDLRLRNRITKYEGQSGAGLVGKFLSGTTNGFVLADISDIQGVDSYVTGGTWNPNILTLNLNNGKPSVNVTINAFTALTVGNLTATGTTSLSGSAYYYGTITGTNPNELINLDYLTGFTQDNDVYVTGNTLTPAGNNTNTQILDLTYHGTPIGGPYFLGAEDTFTTGGTYNNGTKLITFDKNNGSSYTVDLSTIDTNDTFVTGGTVSYNGPDATLTLTRNDNVNVTITGFTDVYTTGSTLIGSTAYFNTNEALSAYTLDLSSFVPTGDTYVTGFTYNPATNTFTISQDDGPTLTAQINSVTGLTVSSLGANRVVYTNGSGALATEAGFEYNAGTNLLTVGDLNVTNPSGTTANIGQGGLVIGSGGSLATPGIGDLTVHGNLTVFGTETVVATTELYVEDPQITLNYNPTGATNVTSIASGIRVQDGNGVSGDTYFTIAQMNTFTGLTPNQVPVITEYTGPTGYANRAWLTQLNDIVIRNTNLNEGAPNGVRVLAEFDILDGGTY